MSDEDPHSLIFKTQGQQTKLDVLRVLNIPLELRANLEEMGLLQIKNTPQNSNEAIKPYIECF